MIAESQSTTAALLMSFFLALTGYLQPTVSLTTNSLYRHQSYAHRRSHHGGRRPCLCGDCRSPLSLSIARRPWAMISGVGASHCLASDGNANSDEKMHNACNGGQTRRSFLERSALSTLSLATSLFGLVADAGARGLVRFPCREPLLNTYHFLRAGSSLLELEDIWSTNPLFLTNREAALSDLGDLQVREACKLLKSTGSTPTVIRYSLAAACSDTADIVGQELRVGRDRIVPEFNYMDPRAIGGWDYAALNATEEAVWALDADEAGPSGRGGRPPPNEDGTPAETLADQVVRLTNLMSVLETQYSGDTVLLVFPDGTGPALLSCLIGGIPLNRVHELQFSPGEIRRDVSYGSVSELTSRVPPQIYSDILVRGRLELKQLRENPDALRNVKDLTYEQEMKQERELELRRREEKEARELERQRKKKEIEAKRRELELKRKDEERKREIEKERKKKEILQSNKGKIDESRSSLDAGSLGRREEAETRDLEMRRKREERENKRRELEAKSREEAEARDLEMRRNREERENKRRELEMKRREAARARETGKERKRKEMSQSENDKIATSQSSLDPGSLGVAAAAVAAAAAAGSGALGGSPDGDVDDETSRDSASLPVDSEDNAVSPDGVAVRLGVIGANGSGEIIVNGKQSTDDNGDKHLRDSAPLPVDSKNSTSLSVVASTSSSMKEGNGAREINVNGRMKSSVDGDAGNATMLDLAPPPIDSKDDASSLDDPLASIETAAAAADGPDTPGGPLDGDVGDATLRKSAQLLIDSEDNVGSVDEAAVRSRMIGGNGSGEIIVNGKHPTEGVENSVGGDAGKIMLGKVPSPVDSGDVASSLDGPHDELIIDLLPGSLPEETPSEAIKATPNVGQAQPLDEMDYENAWLGAISDIMNDLDGEGN